MRGRVDRENRTCESSPRAGRDCKYGRVECGVSDTPTFLSASTPVLSDRGSSVPPNRRHQRLPEGRDRAVHGRRRVHANTAVMMAAVVIRVVAGKGRGDDPQD